MLAHCSAHSEPRHYTEFHFDFFSRELADSGRARQFKVEEAACDIGDFSSYALGEGSGNASQAGLSAANISWDATEDMYHWYVEATPFSSGILAYQPKF